MQFSETRFFEGLKGNFLSMPLSGAKWMWSRYWKPWLCETRTCISTVRYFIQDVIEHNIQSNKHSSDNHNLSLNCFWSITWAAAAYHSLHIRKHAKSAQIGEKTVTPLYIHLPDQLGWLQLLSTLEVLMRFLCQFWCFIRLHIYLFHPVINIYKHQHSASLRRRRSSPADFERAFTRSFCTSEALRSERLWQYGATKTSGFLVISKSNMNHKYDLNSHNVLVNIRLIFLLNFAGHTLSSRSKQWKSWSKRYTLATESYWIELLLALPWPEFKLSILVT